MGIVLFIILLIASYFGLKGTAGHPVAQVSFADALREGNQAEAANRAMQQGEI